MNNLYESSNGHVRLVGVLPDGTIAPTGAIAGAGIVSLFSDNWRAVNHAISADGSRIVFAAAADGGEPAPSQEGMTELYDRVDGATTVEISAPASGAIPANSNPEPAQFSAASNDGSQIFFTSSAELTTASNTGTENNSSDLYRYNADTHSLTDLTLDTNPADASNGAGVQGVAGASLDGSYVYFVATGELLSGQGVDGQPNLYVWHEDSITHESRLDFIATLNEEDSHDWTSRPFELQSYVVPDGRHLAFMSLNSLTGYDNTDRNTHAADSEVYEYTAATHELVCASCDPNGTPPVGPAFIGATREHLASTAFYQPRTLSDDGSRVFFSSINHLISDDKSPFSKIYEYEQDGVGDCHAASSCTYLLSNGASGGRGAEDVFLDADAAGDNVFFSTLSRLSTTDTDSLSDVYDARVDGGFASPPTPINCSTGCTSPIAGTPSPPSPPGSQLALADATRASGTSPSKKSPMKPTKGSCQSKVKRIRNAKARTRALRRCRHSKRTGTSRGAGR